MSVPRKPPIKRGGLSGIPIDTSYTLIGDPGSSPGTKQKETIARPHQRGGLFYLTATTIT